MSYESQDKMVSHPDHYIHGGMETIDVIEAFIEGLPAKEAFLAGQVIKYISRWHSKNGLQDLEKANWYLSRLIDHVKRADVEADILRFDEEQFDMRCGTHIELPDILKSNNGGTKECQ